MFLAPIPGLPNPLREKRSGSAYRYLSLSVLTLLSTSKP